jgi:hypothetical protein
MGWGWVDLVLRPLFGLLYQPRMLNDDCGTIGGMQIVRGNGGTRRKPAPLPLCAPQIPHDLTEARTRAADVWSRRPSAWAMTRPYVTGCYNIEKLVSAFMFRSVTIYIRLNRFSAYVHILVSHWFVRRKNKCMAFYIQVPCNWKQLHQFYSYAVGLAVRIPVTL